MKIAFDVPDAVAETLRMVVEKCATEASTHGPLTLPEMFQMIAEDIALTETRPGSWEAVNMAHVFTSHGYNI